MTVVTLLEVHIRRSTALALKERPTLLTFTTVSRERCKFPLGHHIFSTPFTRLVPPVETLKFNPRERRSRSLSKEPNKSHHSPVGKSDWQILLKTASDRSDVNRTCSAGVQNPLVVGCDFRAIGSGIIDVFQDLECGVEPIAIRGFVFGERSRRTSEAIYSGG